MTTARKDLEPTHKSQLAAHARELADLREEVAKLRSRIRAQELLNPRLKPPPPEPVAEVRGDGTGGMPFAPTIPRGWRA